MSGTQGQEFLGNESAMAWQARVETPQVGARAPVAALQPRGREALHRGLAAAWAACGVFERVALGYLSLSGALIVIFAENLAHPVRLLVVHALVALLILALCRAEANVWADPSICPRESIERNEKNCRTVTQRFWHFWRYWYPHLFFLFCFEELGALVHLVSPRWQDAKLIAFDHGLTTVHPAIWLEQFATPGRNEFMQFAYITYFLYLLVLGGVLYWREDWKGYWSVMTYSAVAYAIGYVIAIFFPIESPWFAMAGAWHGPLRGGLFTSVINLIEDYGRVRGAAFPSEHVAGSIAALLGAWRHRRWLFWVMLPLVVCMCVSTVWGRYHYVADVFAGMITGMLGYVMGKWVMRKWEEVGSRRSERESALSR